MTQPLSTVLDRVFIAARAATSLAAIALLAADPTSTIPSPAPAGLKTIIRVRTTPFCQTFRENVFHTVQGLRINDEIIDHGQLVLAKWGYDSVADHGGPSVRMDHYQIGLVMGQLAHNLKQIYGLLNDPDRFPVVPGDDADRELGTMKTTLQAVADAQERSLDILSGLYETQALNTLLSLGNDTAGALGQASIGDKQLELGDPILASPSYSPPPTTASNAHASLFATTPVGRIRRAVVVSQRITSSVEQPVVDAVMIGVKRCSEQ